MAATLKNIAKKSGYSVTTVSRALNGHSDVNEETRRKIEQVARELSYFPNRMAQQLVTRKTNVIGLYSLDRQTFQNQFIHLMISGMMDEATRHNFNLLLFATQHLQTAEEMVVQCRARGLGGAVIAGLRTDEPLLNDLAQTDFPLVLIDLPVMGPKTTFVSVDNVQGAKKAVDHLAGLGHRSIGFVNGHSQAWVSQERLAGYRQGMLENGLQVETSYIFEGDFSKESGRQGAKRLLEANPNLTAIFAASDLMAVGVLEQLQSMNVVVPNQISVIGFDDQDFTTHVTPALSTVRQDMYRFGTVAAKELVAMVEDEAYVPKHEDLPSVLVPRGSTGPVCTSES